MEQDTQATVLSDFITEFCSKHPEQLVAQIIDVNKSSNDALAVSGITAKKLLSDGRRAADYLFDKAGRSIGVTDAPTNVSILARTGYDYLVNFIGITLNNWTPVLVSTRNSLEAVTELVRLSDSRCLFVDDLCYPMAQSVKEQIPDVLVIKFETTRDYKDPKDEPWSARSNRCDADEPALYLHSSGTTGHPKLIPIPHRVFLLRLYRLAEVKYAGNAAYAPVPFFHTMGLLATLGWPMASGLQTIIVETNKPVTGEFVVRMLQQFPGMVVLLAPATLIEMLELGDVAIDALVSAHRIMFAGAPLPKEVGNELAMRGVKLMGMFGTTENGGMTFTDLSSDDPMDWEYIRFRDTSDIILSRLDSRRTAQLHVKPGEFLPPSLVDPEDPYGYSSGDVFEEHPTKPGLWKHVGRKASVTVLSNGEKTDNAQLENILQSDPLVSHAVVFGSGRFQNGVILQQVSGSALSSTEGFLGAVWETVEKANAIIPRHSRLVRTLVLVADPNRGISLTDKGTARRQETIDMYQTEIDAAYENLEKEAFTMDVDIPKASDGAAVLRYIREGVYKVMKKHLDDDDDLFEQGLDSLSALELRASIMPIINASRPGEKVPRNLVYHHPSIARLARYVTTGHAGSTEQPSTTVAARMNQIIEDMVSQLKPRGDRMVPAHEDHPPNVNKTILLTGSTGTFGSQILAKLLKNQSVKKIWCLNRPHTSVDIVQRHRSQMDEPNLITEHEEKLEFANMDIRKTALGLPEGTLEMIRTTVTHIVHCAWDTNFNHDLEHFVNTQIAGVKELAQISLSSKRDVPPRLYFISSIAAVGAHSDQSIPEQFFEDASVPLQQGYGQSKYVSERILSQASSMTGLPVTIVRAGQLAGSTATGVWNKNEYVFHLLQSSLAIGKFPNWLPDVRWIPTDVSARVLTEIMFSGRDDCADVFHLENPCATRGSDLVQWIIELAEGALVPVSASEWLETIVESSSKSAAVKNAERLYDFFHSWLDRNNSFREKSLSVEKTMAASTALNCGPISRELLAKYVQYVFNNN